MGKRKGERDFSFPISLIEWYYERSVTSMFQENNIILYISTNEDIQFKIQVYTENKSTKKEVKQSSRHIQAYLLSNKWTIPLDLSIETIAKPDPTHFVVVAYWLEILHGVVRIYDSNYLFLGLQEIVISRKNQESNILY